MTVVDASITVRLLLNRRGDEKLRDRFARDRYLHAPALIDAEVTSAIRGLTLASKVATARAHRMIEDFADLPVVRYPMQPHQRRVLELRHDLTAYDAFYVTLAEALDMPLLTDDRKSTATTGHTVVIELFG